MGLPRLNGRAALRCAWVSWALWSCQSAPDTNDHALGAAGAPAVAATLARGSVAEGCPGAPQFSVRDQAEMHTSASGFFRVYFARNGTHAVPNTDSDRDGLPDYVQHVGESFDEVLAFYRQLDYREPRHTGTEQFEVQLLNFPTSADGQYCRTDCDAQGCSGYMLLENDFNGRNYSSREAAVRLVASHELFHAIQAAYTNSASTLLSEGTAVWASEAFDATTGDLERQAVAYLQQPERTLTEDPAGTFDGFAYGSALFFQFLSEREGDELIRELWEALAQDGQSDPDRWPNVLDQVLQRRGSSLAQAFKDFAQWNLYTGKRADDTVSYANGAALPAITERSIELPYSDDAVRVFPLSARYYTLRADTAQTVAAAAQLADDHGETGLELLLARERDGKITELHWAQDKPGHRAELRLEATETLHIIVLNTRSGGESARPDICIGNPTAVDTCLGTTPPRSQASGCSVVEGPKTLPWNYGLSVFCSAGLLVWRRLRRGSASEA